MKITMKDAGYGIPKYFDENGDEYLIILPMGAINIADHNVICIHRVEYFSEHGHSSSIRTHEWIDTQTGMPTSALANGAEISEADENNFKKLIKKQVNNTGVNLEGAGYKLVDGVWVK